MTRTLGPWRFTRAARQANAQTISSTPESMTMRTFQITSNAPYGKKGPTATIEAATPHAEGEKFTAALCAVERVT